MIEFSETVEDERAAGIELEEIGQRFDLEVVKISNIDRDGNGGTKVDAQVSKLISAYPVLLQNIFGGASVKTCQCSKCRTAHLPGSPRQITPSRVKPLDEVRADAITQWQLAERSKLLEAMAEHFVKKGNEKR